ncbi:MAG: metallophosphoesterase [Verrucomicrobiota bacterium]
MLLLIPCMGIGESLLPDYQLQQEEPSPSDFSKGAWSVVVIPDTQNYVYPPKLERRYYDILDGMMQWIAANKDVRNIEAVVHVGDMTNNNTQKEWKIIRSCYSHLDGKVAYVVCEGNHDRNKKKKRRPGRATRMNEVFKIDQNPLNRKIFGGSFEAGQLQNAYYTFTQNGQEFLMLALEYMTREDVVDWAVDVIKKHPEHRVFITVHEYMSELSRLDSADGHPVPHSKREEHKQVYDLVMENPNVEFVVCGHHAALVLIEKLSPEEQEKARARNVGKNHPGYDRYALDRDIATGHRTDIRENGLAVHQILFNAQWIPNGGDGWMLLLEFQPDNKTVEVKTFSPYLEKWRTGPEFRYTLNRSFGGNHRDTQ